MFTLLQVIAYLREGKSLELQKSARPVVRLHAWPEAQRPHGGQCIQRQERQGL